MKSDNSSYCSRKAKERLYTSPGRGAKRSRKRAQTPWVLGSNHEDLSAQEIIDIYALRMQIEELFRDLKNKPIWLVF